MFSYSILMKLYLLFNVLLSFIWQYQSGLASIQDYFLDDNSKAYVFPVKYQDFSEKIYSVAEQSVTM